MAVDTVMEHIKVCETCRDTDVRASEDVDGLALLEFSTIPIPD